MKLVISSDIHNDRLIIYKLVETIKKENPDFLILLGDISNMGEIREGFISILSKYIPPERILILPGNHETPDLIESLEKIYNVKDFHMKYIIYKDLVLVGIGGGDVPMFMISESEIEEFLNKISDKIKDKKVILLTHLPPKDSLTSMDISGSYALLNFIKKEKPILHVHGHIHEGGGLEDIIYKTKVINAAEEIILIEIGDQNIKIRKIL